jgi:hypothetical protein
MRFRKIILCIVGVTGLTASSHPIIAVFYCVPFGAFFAAWGKKMH